MQLVFMSMIDNFWNWPFKVDGELAYSHTT